MTLKVCLVGPFGSGKTTYLNKLTQKSIYNVETTIGTSFTSYDFEGTQVQIYDTAGQEQYASFTQQYIRQASIILLVTDANDSSYDSRSKDIFSNLPKDVAVISIMNKIDLVDESEKQNVEKRGHEIAPNTPTFLVSALYGDNIKESFREGIKLSKKLPKNQDNGMNILQTQSNKKQDCC